MNFKKGGKGEVSPSLYILVKNCIQLKGTIPCIALGALSNYSPCVDH